jgi:hypothetical protein
MDRVTISLQNKELIEDIINSSDEVKARIHNAIIDGVSKRITKNVVTNMDASVKAAIETAQMELHKKYMDETRQGWSSHYKLKEQYRQCVEGAVRKAWSDEIDRSIQEVKEKVKAAYQTRLERAYQNYIAKIEEMTDHLDDKIKEAVSENISRRLNG